MENVFEKILNWILTTDLSTIIAIFALYFSNRFSRRAMRLDLEQDIEEKIAVEFEKRHRLMEKEYKKQNDVPGEVLRPYFVLEIGDEDISEKNGYLSIRLRNIGNSNATSIALKRMNEKELFRIMNKSVNVILRGYFEQTYVLTNDVAKIDVLISENAEKTELGEASDNITFKIYYSDIYDRVYEQEFSFDFNYTYGMLKNVKQRKAVCVDANDEDLNR